MPSLQKLIFKKSEKNRAIHEQVPNTTIIFIYSLYSMGIPMRYDNQAHSYRKPAAAGFFGEL